MTRTEHLLTILAEECAEVAVRVSKALRFGLGEVQPGQPLSNADRVTYELIDLIAVLEMLTDEGAIPAIHQPLANEDVAVAAKKEKVEKFLRYSAECGTLTRSES